MRPNDAGTGSDVWQEIDTRGSPDVHGWQPIDTAPKNQKVLVAYRNRLDHWRIVTACYHTHLGWAEEYYDPEAKEEDSEFAPEGWYEESDSHDVILRTNEPPTHWMPLPRPPAGPAS